MNRLGELLRRLRDERGLSAEELASAMGIDASTLGQIERGEIARPPDARLRAAARAMGVSFERLIQAIPERVRDVSEMRLAEIMLAPLGSAPALETVDEAPVLRGVTLIRAGESRNGNVYTAELLRRDGPGVFEGAPAYVTNHRPEDKTINNLVGVYRGVRLEGDALVADLHGLPSALPQLQRALEAHRELGAERVGLSIDTAARGSRRRTPRGHVREVEALIRTPQTSVDLVINPSAGGRLTESLEGDSEMRERIAQLTEAVLSAMGPAAVRYLIDGLTAEDVREANPGLADAILARASERDEPAAAQEQEPPAATGEGVQEIVQREVEQRLRLLECRQALESRLAAAQDLDEISRELVTARFDGRVFEAAELDRELARVRDIRGRQNPRRPDVPGGSIQVQESHDLHRLRLEGFFRNTPMRDRSGAPVQPYRSFRWEILPQMAGIDPGDQQACREALGMLVWQGDLVRTREMQAREAISAGTFDQAWADVMNRVLLDMVGTPDLNNWRQWTITVPFQDLTNTRKFVRFGGYGTFSTVAENGTYQAITTPGDEQVAFVPSKYGGLEEISWEAILRDDVRLISRIPMALGRGWAWTVYDGIYSVLQSNSGNGPTMDYDSTALYNARTVTNIVDSALSETSLNTARTQMGKMVELSSSKRTLYRPRFLLFASPDLDLTAFNLTGQALRVTSNSDATLANFFRPDGPNQIIPIPVAYPTATTQRAELVADPQEVETAYVGFLGGRSEPEVFVQDAETVGSRFTADKVTYKLRGTFGFEVANHRAFQRIQNT